MKYNSFELAKIARYEQKRGIHYARTDGKMYRCLFAFGLIDWLYMMLMSAFYLLGRYFEISANNGKYDNIFISILTTAAVLLLSPIIYAFASKIAGLIINLIGVPVLAAAFAKISLVSESISSAGSTISQYDSGFFGLKKMFFWRHGVPMLAVFVICVTLIIIIIRERRIRKKEFDIIMNGNYVSEIIENNE